MTKPKTEPLGAIAPTDAFGFLPLTSLHESPRNPRKHFDAKALAELTESIRRSGVLTPLLVRPNGQGYEIAAGHRRYRAAKAAGVTEVPARIRTMTDAEFLELLTIDNLQREDVHPLDEAVGYQQLLALPGYDVDGIAAKVGKSASYIYQRLKLAELTEPFKKAFWAEEITAGHAILLARLQPKDQAAALAMFREQLRYRQSVSVRDLSRWIEENVHLDLHAAPFKKDDAALLPAAGACATCPKRTGYNPSLFPDVAKKDTCTDRACFQAKLAAHLTAKKAELAKTHANVLEISSHWGNAKPKAGGPIPAGLWHECKKTDKGAVTALVVAGRDAGTVKTVTLQAPSGGRNADVDSWQAQARKREKAAQRKHLIRRRIFTAVCAKLPTMLGTADLLTVVTGYVAEMHHDTRKILCSVHDWEAKKNRFGGWDYVETIIRRAGQLADTALVQLLLELPLIGELGEQFGTDRTDLLLTTAKRYRVNTAAIERGVRAEEQAKATKAKAKKGKAKTTTVQTSAKKPRAGDVARAKKAAKKRTAAATMLDERTVACERCGCTWGNPCSGGCAWDPRLWKQGRAVCTSCAVAIGARR